MQKKRYFSEFGSLEWLPREDYFKGNWRYVGSEYDDYDDESYDIVEKNMEYRYTQI